MTTIPAPRYPVFRFGLLAYLGATVSLFFCFWKAVSGLLAPLIGLTVIDLNPHLQAIIMWGFAAITVAALVADRQNHGDRMPLLLGGIAFVIIVATLYTFYHDGILATGYVLLLIAAFMNQNKMLAHLNQKVQSQADELAANNRLLEQRVSEQVGEIERLARLRRFLPQEVADLITAEDKESLLDSHRGYITCLFCDIRRFTSMTEAMEPEDVMKVLRGFHETVGRLAVAHGGTIGYRAGDGVMMFINDPIPCDDPDLRAIKLALALRDAFAVLRRDWAVLDVDVGLGIGIASGYATMGVIGVEGRFDYTPIGNAVNLAARLSDQAEDNEILMSRRTRSAVADQVTASSAGALRLKGFANPVEAYFLEALRSDPDSA